MWRVLTLVGLVCVVGALFSAWWPVWSIKVGRDDRPAFRINADEPYLIALGRVDSR
jgi:hypothetical protein